MLTNTLSSTLQREENNSGQCTTLQDIYCISVTTIGHRFIYINMNKYSCTFRGSNNAIKLTLQTRRNCMIVICSKRDNNVIYKIMSFL